MSSHHPAKDLLLAFGQGKLAADESSSVEQHLEVCRECCETLLDLKDDTFVGLVKIAQPSDVDRRMGTLARPAAESGKTEADKTGTGKSAHPTDAATVLVQSGAPVGPDELPAELAEHPRYHIVELIGHGGMGNVYRAEHRLMNRAVAIKLINSQLMQHPHAVERFRREVQAAAKLSHPNIVAAYDAEQAGNAHFLVMEFVEGTDLASVVKHRGPMSVAEASECIRQAAVGLQHAHEKGMVHRDIKPHNLMFAAGGQVRILDFGLAAFASLECGDSSPLSLAQTVGEQQTANEVSQSGDESPQSKGHLTTIGSVMGTPDYMAPEQAVDAHSADIRADIYSLGCTLHFLLTGQPPFAADNVLMKLKAHAQEPPPLLTTLRKDVPAELAKIAARMMAKTPAERFQTPAEVAAALDSFARPAVAPQRKRSLQKILAAAAAILMAGVIYITTDKGRIEIRTDVDDVEVVVSHGGQEVKTIDLATGSQVTWMPSGDYTISLKQDRNDIQITPKGFTLSRWGKQIVSLSHLPASAVAKRQDNLPDGAMSETVTAGFNGSFEVIKSGLPVSWSFYTPRTVPTGDFDIVMDTTDFKEGEQSLKFVVRKCDSTGGRLSPGFFNEFHMANHNPPAAFETKPGETYKISFWAKNAGSEFVFKARGVSAFGGDKGVVLQSNETINAWRRFECIYTIPPKMWLRLELNVVQPGTFWIDDIQIVRVNEKAPAAPSVSDEQGLQGKWIAVSGHARKKPLTAAEIAQLSITFDGERVEFIQPSGPPTPQAVTFTINSNRDPKQIDFVAPGKQEAMPGIYQFDGERLKLALIDQDYSRPTNFDPDHRPDHLTAVFERVAVAAALGQEEQTALKAAEAYLAVVDADNFDRLFDIGSNLAKKQVTREQILQTYQTIRNTLGRLEKRTLRRVRLIDEFIGLPAGRYAAVQYVSDFEKHKGLWESVLLNVDDDGQWRANTYAATVQPLPLPEPKRGAGFQPAGSGKPLERQAGSLPHGQPSAVPMGANLITDPSFENTGLTQLPRDWRAWTNEDSDFRCEVVNGGHTGQRSLRISGKGTRGVVFGNDIKADRTKRYALKGWAKFEGDKDARAIIKFNYFRGSEFLGVHDLIGVTADQPGWHLLEKTDALDAYPQADHFYAMCHVEGSGSGWFDDLELIAYDRDKLPADFDSRHGRHNRLTGPNSLGRWVGAWETEYVFRETDNSPNETRLTMNTASERMLGGYFLLSHAKAVPATSKDRKPPLADPPANSAAVGGEERLLFLTFDQNLGAFRQWFFSSNGKAFEWRGPWDDATKSLALRMLPDASNLFSSEHFVDADHIEAKLRFQYVMGMKDAGRWTATRKAAAAKVDVPAAKSRAAEPAELSQLDKFTGEWTIRATYKPSVWNPQQREETIRETSIWILGGRFLMTRAFNEKDELTSIWIATYEPLEKSNHFWFFNADGSSGQWRLTWDAASRGFHFRSIDMPAGWIGTGFNRWINDDTFDNQALIKDETGRVLLDSSQDKWRKK